MYCQPFPLHFKQTVPPILESPGRTMSAPGGGPPRHTVTEGLKFEDDDQPVGNDDPKGCPGPWNECWECDGLAEGG
ncbi:hypothetical protein RHS01_03550 [Rhizoctonia solani]|uniref:Uncharacterized protein n=1 Tax=Rhizoctonia solani TaxID=456999 RepID=A0A8H7IHE3_9AGAM|nr:hypothetical protein RHS01_03550 [Rhizoctonia solani]